MLHVGMIAIGDVDTPPSSDTALVLVIEPLKAVQIMEIPSGGRVLAVDFERVERLVAAGIARRFEKGERPVLEPSHERARVVDAG